MADPSVSPQKVYVVTSYAFGMDSDVRFHYLGPDLSKATAVYDEVSSREDAQPSGDDPYKLLVDLTEVDSGFCGDFTLFWGRNRADCKTLITNNN